jgi:hypothetical protein
LLYAVQPAGTLEDYFIEKKALPPTEEEDKDMQETMASNCWVPVPNCDSMRFTIQTPSSLSVIFVLH